MNLTTEILGVEATNISTLSAVGECSTAAVGAVVFTTRVETMSDHIVFKHIRYTSGIDFFLVATDVPGSIFERFLLSSCPSGDHQVSEYILQTLSHFSSGAREEHIES